MPLLPSTNRDVSALTTQPFRGLPHWPAHLLFTLRSCPHGASHAKLAPGGGPRPYRGGTFTRGSLREVSVRYMSSSSPKLCLAQPTPTSDSDSNCRVAPGGCPPGAPTDPDVRNSRIRLLGARVRYVARRRTMRGAGSGNRFSSACMRVQVRRPSRERVLSHLRHDRSTS